MPSETIIHPSNSSNPKRITGHDTSRDHRTRGHQDRGSTDLQLYFLTFIRLHEIGAHGNSRMYADTIRTRLLRPIAYHCSNPTPAITLGAWRHQILGKQPSPAICGASSQFSSFGVQEKCITALQQHCLKHPIRASIPSSRWATPRLFQS